MNNVLITGGAGFLGRALLRVFQEKHPEIRCTIFSRDHGKHSICQREFPQHRYIIGDVRDYDSVEKAIAGHDIVVHAAAFKYVPQSETNVTECHAINVTGSQNVALASTRTGVDRVIGISTDKACQPINVYGITKLMMERIFQETDRLSATQFNLVRYGNVVSSTGSAIPIFRRQAREGKIVSVTNPDMTRFWLSVYDGAELIMKSLEEEKGGTILIPRLGSLSILEVAKAAVQIECDGEPEGIRYEVIGERFGEKKHEDLLGEVEAAYAEMVDKKLMRLYPMTSPPVNQITEKYNSEHPDNTMTIDQAIQMIHDAPDMEEKPTKHTRGSTITADHLF